MDFPKKPKVHAAILVAVSALLLLSMTMAATYRGPWYDEFYTYYITKPKTSFSQNWPIWLSDNHPPLYYFLAWVTNWLGNEVEQRRLVNLAFFVFAAISLIAIVKARPKFNVTLFYYALALAGYTQTIQFSSEFRSYFLSMCAGSIIIFALSAFFEPFSRKIPTKIAVAIIILLSICFYIHFVTTIILSSIGIAFGIRLLLMKDWRGARLLASIGLLAALPLVATLAFQYSTILHNTRTFWIPAGFTAARWAITAAIKSNLLANPLLTLAAAAGLLALLLEDWRARRMSEATSLVITLSCGLALALVVLIGLHLRHPIVTSRYLASLHPALAMIFATGIVELSRRIGNVRSMILDILLAVGAVIAIHHNLRQVIAEASWDGTGSAIAKIVQRCPTTTVHVDSYWNAATMAMPPIQNSQVFPFAYARTASRFGFALAPAGSRELSKDCPTVFWTEHGVTYEPRAQEILTHLRAEGFAVRKGWLQPIGWGWIFVAEPTPQPRPTAIPAIASTDPVPKTP